MKNLRLHVRAYLWTVNILEDLDHNWPGSLVTTPPSFGWWKIFGFPSLRTHSLERHKGG